MKQYLEPEGLAPPLDPYSHAIRCGDTVWIAGQVALDNENRLVGIGDPRRQAEQIWHNIECAIRGAGGTLADVVKITIFIKDIRHGNDEIEVRKTKFATGRFPICTQVQVANLALPELLFEIDAVASLESS
jgi:enamine deaminase RidA (YjgF/YER057c/UK114 family)